jgi:hypothetical protein
MRSDRLKAELQIRFAEPRAVATGLPPGDCRNGKLNIRMRVPVQHGAKVKTTTPSTNHSKAKINP